MSPTGCPLLRRLARAALTLALLAASRTAEGLEPSSALAHYGYDVWDSDSGLPQNSVTAIVQTRDGYLWLGTQEGLVRFDGVHFRVFDTRNTPALGDDFVHALCQTRNGDLWVGTSNGLSKVEAGQFTRMTFGDTFDGQSVTAIHESDDGALWIGSREGVSRLQGQILTRFWKRGTPPAFIRAIAELPGGEMWFGGKAQILRYRNGRLTSFGSETGVHGAVYALAPTGTGGLWVGSADGLARLQNGRAEPFPLGSRPDRTVRSIYHDRSGTLWVGTLSGVFGLRDGRLMQFSRSNGLASDEVLSILEDREGSLWIGTGDAGLNRLKDQRIANYTVRDGLADNNVFTVFEDRDRTLWVGTRNGVLSRMLPGEDRLTQAHDFGARVTTIAQDAAGDLWVGTRDNGLFQSTRAGWRRSGVEEGLPGLYISSVCPSRDGTLWVATLGGGIAHFDGGRVTRYDRRNGLPSDAAMSLFEDRDGDLWIGTLGGGLVRRHEGRFQTFTTRDGLPHNVVLSIEQDHSGTYWLGTRGGLARFDGRAFTTYRENEGVFHDTVQRAVDDGHGYLWLTTNRGVFRVGLDELNGAAARPSHGIHPVGFATANGMRSAECNNSQHGVARSEDGRLWFATSKGLAMADPQHIQINRVPPQVVVEEVLANGRRLSEATGLKLAPDQRDLEIHYTALSFRQPGAIRFQYRLERFDSAWIDAGARRIAYYTNLPSGHYRFQIRASNEDGLWSAPQSALSFSIARHVYDTLWFRAVCAVALVLAVGATHRARLRRLRQREGMRAELVEAKLHALRAQLRPHFLFNTFNAILPYIDADPPRAKRMILQLAELLRTSLKSEPGQLVSVDDELSILEQYTNIERTRFGDRVRIAVEVDPAVRTARVPSFLLQPLVENAIKYGMQGFAGPVSVTVVVRPEGEHLTLSVRDNGRGLPDGTRPAEATGIGISNVRRRLEALYPKRHLFEVRNLPEGGCEAFVEIPLDQPRTARRTEQSVRDRASA
ncbi:MAG: two-component regulator propeller domain-containing protein [Acidobacteriota bacterium]